MTRRRWKQVQPRSMQEALRTCLEYAEFKYNRNTKRVADLNGIAEWTIYKWIAEGSIPSRRIPPFELACGCHYVTGFLANTAQKLMIDIPTGRAVSQDDLLDLQSLLGEAITHLRRFYQAGGEPAEAIGKLNDVMGALAGHRENVVKHDTPELGMFEDDSE